MENKVLQDNIEQIKKYDDKFANEILMFENEKSNVELAQNENGEYNLLFNSVPLHSTNGAILEAQQIASHFENNENIVKIIYGLGLGYLADITSQKIKQGKIIIYEPNIEIIKFVLSIAKIDALFQNNVFLCSNKNVIFDYIKKITDEESILSISFLNSYKIYLEDIKDTLFLAQKAQGENIGNINTFIDRAPKAYTYNLYNLKNIIKNPNISDIKDIYKGKTALIACAGPSLKENIEIIKHNQDKFVIFALNSTAKLLIENGIHPDFIVIIENIECIHQFNLVNTKDYYFIQETFVEPEISNFETKKTFNYISKNNYLNNWTRDCLKLKDDLNSFGTVSYTALMSAFIMGFDEIILVGQNLAYDGTKCYSSNCHIGEIECVYDEKLKKYKIITEEAEFINSLKDKGTDEESAKNILKNYIEELNKNLCSVKSQTGEIIPSKTDYAIFIQCFEQAAKKIKEQKPNIKLFNSSTRGAQIDGFENRTLKEIVEKLEKIDKLDLSNYQANINKEHILNKIDELSLHIQLHDTNLRNVQKGIMDYKENKIDKNKLDELISKAFLNISSLQNSSIGYFAETFYLLRIKKDFKLNPLQNPKIPNEKLDELNGLTLWGIEHAQWMQKTLCDCKSFILE